MSIITKSQAETIQKLIRDQQFPGQVIQALAVGDLEIAENGEVSRWEDRPPKPLHCDVPLVSTGQGTSRVDYWPEPINAAMANNCRYVGIQRDENGGFAGYMYECQETGTTVMVENCEDLREKLRETRRKFENDAT